MRRIIELEVKDAWMEGNLSRTIPSQIRRRIGKCNITPLSVGDGSMGMAVDRDGKSWDWWVENGEVVIIPSK